MKTFPSVFQNMVTVELFSQKSSHRSEFSFGLKGLFLKSTFILPLYFEFSEDKFLLGSCFDAPSTLSKRSSAVHV